jgi:hypothetical protein
MMCQPCKDAGAFSFQALDKSLKRKERERLRSEGEILHGECRDPNTCTCQHRVPK